MAVYSDQETRPETIENDDLNKITGKDTTERQELSDEATEEKNQLEDNDNEINNNTEGKKKNNARSRLTARTKNTLTGLLLGVTAGVGVSGISIVHGPLQILHFSKLLSNFHFSGIEDTANGRTSKYMYHRARGGSVGEAKMKTRLGVVGNRLADKMELRLQDTTGLKPLYHPVSGTLIGYEVIDERKATRTLIESDIVSDDMEFTSNDVDVDARDSNGNGPDKKNRKLLYRADGDGKRMSIKTRRDFSRKLTKSMGMSKIASYISFRRTAIRGGISLHPIRRADARISEAFGDFRVKMREKWENEVRNGAKKVDVDLRQDSPDGEGEKTADSEKANNDAKQAMDEARAGSDSKAKLKARFAGASVLSVGILCAVKGVIESSEDLKHSNIVLPLMRIGGRMTALGSQIMSGDDIDMRSLAVVYETLHDKELGSWLEAKSVQAELGKEQTGIDIPPTAKPSRVNEQPKMLQVVSDVFDAAGKAGDFACNALVQWAVDAVMGGPVKAMVSELVGRLASAANINPMDYLMGWIVDVLAGEEVDASPVGADLGNLANYGVRLAANDNANSMAGSKLSPKQVTEIDNHIKNRRKKEFNSKPLLARLFDVRDTQSFASITLGRSTSLNYIKGNSPSVFTGLLNIGSLLSSSFANIANPKLHAQTASASYDYGFDEFGFTLDEQDDERYDDPYDNALIVKETLGLDNLSDNYKECFLTYVDSSEELKQNDEARLDKIADNEKCNDRGNEELTRYRFFIMDTVLVNSLLCYEGESDSCSQIGVESSSGSSSTTSATDSDSEVNPNQDTSSMTCPPGTEDDGVHQDYGPGRVETVKIRICNVKNVTGVNVSIAQKTLDLLTAAEQEGMSLSGSSFRSYDSQASLRTTNGCPDVDKSPSSSCRVPTARPGNSMHELGLAIDFGDMCFGAGNSTCPSKKEWVWLTQNAARFGFKQLSSEAWHWSINGN